MGRTILGILAGLATMFVVVMAIELLDHAIYPPPAGLNPMVTSDLEAITAAMPIGAKAIVVFAWLAGAFAGGWVSARIARAHRRFAAAIVALLVMSGVVGMWFELPNPVWWMIAAGLLLPIPVALYAARLATPRAIL